MFHSWVGCTITQLITCFGNPPPFFFIIFFFAPILFLQGYNNLILHSRTRPRWQRAAIQGFRINLKMAEQEHTEQIQPENAMHRVARIPLVHSALQIVSFAYRDVKNVSPLAGNFFDASERGVKAISQIAALSFAPVLHLVEPQIATVNQAALWMVDELEVRVPVLDQPANQVLSGFTGNMASWVHCLRDQALNRLQNGIDGARASMKDAQDAISLVAITIGSLGLRELLTFGSELALSGAENLVDHYLPLEGNGEQESVSSEEMEGTQNIVPGLVFRTLFLVNTIVTRLVSRLSTYLGTPLDLPHGTVRLLLGFPYKMKERFWKAMADLLFPKRSEENTKRKEEPRKSKRDATKKLIRSPNRKRTYSEPKPYGYYRKVIHGRATVDTRRHSAEMSEERLQTQCRPQSLDGYQAACPQD
uniref:Uncharacterized protein n=1 Tax=Leptobrachium leishanense TaxID=445787 RepID=A0A8C5PX11_9ANUR